MKRLALTLALALVPLAAAQGANSYPVTVQHKGGNTVIPKRPLRVAVLGPYALDLLLSIGVQPAGYAEVGVYKLGTPGGPIGEVPYLGPYIKSKPIYLGTREQPSLEAIAALKPDLIVGQDDFHLELYPQLAKLAPTILLPGDDWRAGLKEMGLAFHHETQAKNVQAQLDNDIANLKNALAGYSKRNPHVLLLGFPGIKSGATLNVITEGFSAKLFNELAWPPMKSDGENISLEGVVALNPDVIFVIANSSNTVENAKREWYSTPLLTNMKATKQKKVFIVPNQLWNRIRGPLAGRQILRQVRTMLLETR